MDRAMSVEERIRKAEDIYNRRNRGGYQTSEITKIRNKSKKCKIKKMIMQIMICLLIYVIVYSVINREYIFAEQFRKDVSNAITQNSQLNNIYSTVKNYFNKSEESTQPVNEDTESQPASEEGSEENGIQTNEDNVGGAEDKTEENSDDKTSQMQEDAKYIKENISFIVPVNGTISSTFGWRNPTTSTVPKYHTGLDIATKSGTKIKSATDGKIILASSEGDYGNHYKIQINDVVIIYAHCKKLYLKEGDSVKQGKEIAEVGSTGNSTGPHLHFEIRRNDRKVDPQLIIDI